MDLFLLINYFSVSLRLKPSALAFLKPRTEHFILGGIFAVKKSLIRNGKFKTTLALADGI
jgi:hypothetical protein